MKNDLNKELIRDDEHFIDFQQENLDFKDHDKYQLDPTLDHSPEHWDYISTVVNSFGQIYSTLSLDEVLESVIDSLISVIQAERGFLLLKTPQGRLEFKIARDANHNNLDKKNFKIVKNILLKTYQHKAIYYFDDVSKVQLFPNKHLDSKSIICCPLIIDNDILGLIYADSENPLIGDSKIKQELVQHFSTQAAIAIRNAMFYQLQEQSFVSLSNTSGALIDVEKVAAETKVAASIGHLLNNFLLETSSSLELVTRYLEKNANLDRVADKLGNISFLLKELQSMSNGLVDNIRIETRLANCSINDLVKEFMDFIHTIYAKNNPIFDVQIQSDIPDVKIDKTQMHLALYNICNFFIEKTNIYNFNLQTCYNSDQGRVKLLFSNRFKGLDKSELKQLFQPLTNVEADLENRFGLMICKEIIVKHKGSFTVENLEHGVRFIISLPEI